MLCVTVTPGCRGYTTKGVKEENMRGENVATAVIEVVAYPVNETFPGDAVLILKKKNR